MMTRTRSRNIVYGGQRVGVQEFYGPPVSTNLFDAPKYSLPQTCYDELHRGPPYRTGGPLSIQKKMVTLHLSAPYYADETWFPCRVHTRFYMPLRIHPIFPAESNTSALGPEAWARTLPGSPILNLGNAIFELKDAPAMIRQTRDFFQRMSSLRTAFQSSNSGKTVGDALNAKSPITGGDYLNLQFGWVPMLQDLWGVLTFQKALAKKLAFLKRNNRKVVRVHRELRSSTYQKLVIDTSTGSSVVLGPSVFSSFYTSSNGDARYTTTYRYKRRAWYSAAYVFYIPELEEPFADLTGLKMNLLGLSLDPSTIYHAVPWTWLVDWFTNTGRSVSNAVTMSRFHVVAKYAYVMNTEEHSYTDTGFQHMRPGKFSIIVPPLPAARMYSASTTERRTYKSRVAASPFGFGLSDSAFSAYQWSILAALGLSRLR